MITCKRLSVILLVFMLILLGGCGRNNEQMMRQEEDVTDMTYEAQNLTIDGVKGEIGSFLVKNGKLYFFVYDESEETEQTTICCANLDGSGLQQINLELSGQEYLVSIGVNDETFIGLSSSDNGENMDLIKFDASGKEIQRSNMTEALKLKKETLTGRIFLDVKDSILLVGTENVYVLDYNFGLKHTICIEDGWQIVDIALTKNGQIVCVENEENSDTFSTRVCCLDIEKETWGEELKLDFGALFGGDYIMNGSNADLYYKNTSGIYGYDMASAESKKILDYQASYVTMEEADRMVMTDDGNFLGFLHVDNNEDGQGFVVYTKMDAASMANKKTIVYGTHIASEDIKNEIVSFNRKNKDCRIEIREYYQEQDKLNAEILAGKGPDIFDLSSLSIGQYVKLGLLEDLTPYFDKDAEIEMDDIIPSVSQAMRLNGGFYYVSSGFSVDTIAAKSKDVGKKTGWTFNDVKKLLEEKGDGVNLFDGEDESSKWEMFDFFMNTGCMDYVNLIDGTCDFDSKDFREILRYCNDKGVAKEKEKSDTESIEFYENEPARMREGNILLYVDNCLFPKQIQIDRSMFGEDITYIGYPNKDEQGSYFVLKNQIGISSKSEMKEEAWQFVRTLMTREYQGEHLLNDILPTRQDCFDIKLKEQMAKETYTDEFGNVVEPLEHSWVWGGVEFRYEPVSQEDANMFVDLINNTKKIQSQDMNVYNIVYEEVKVYFEGDRDLDKTVENIQQRVSTYVNEQK